MPQSSRSIVIALSAQQHLAYDTERFRVHTMWKGGPLNLYGPGYHGAKEPFICQPNGERLWGNPPIPEWRWKAAGSVISATNLRPANLRFVAISTKREHPTFIYELLAGEGAPVRIHETPTAVQWGNVGAVSRMISVGPRSGPITFRAHLEAGTLLLGRKTFGAIQRTNDVLAVALRAADPLPVCDITERLVAYSEEVFTEAGASKGNPRKGVRGPHVEFAVHLPAATVATQFEVLTAVVPDEATAQKLAAMLPPTQAAMPDGAWFASTQHSLVARKPFVATADVAPRRSLVRSAHYKVEALPVPKSLELLVTGMDWLPNGDLAVCTWLGDIVIVRGAAGDPAKATYTRVARGLNEPLGLVVVNGKIVVAQKSELTRISDTDSDGEADLFECLNNQWDYTGGYNSFVYGPVSDAAGNLVVANAAHGGRWDARYMGWALRISPDGRKLEPISSGLREPNGIGVFGAARDVFVTENQGQWIGACKLNHLQKGRFFGHPSSWPAPQADYKGRSAFDPPAVWFPYKLARSTTGLVEITGDELGPFKGQLLVGDFQNALLMRVQLEKVGGQWQGAVWPFLSGFLSGVNRLSIGPDGALYVGGCQRTWVSVAPQSYALERVTFNGSVPFEILEAHARSDGFDLRLTKPISSKTTVEDFDVWQYNYKYHAGYGSPELDHDGNPDRQTVIRVKTIALTADGRGLRLGLEGLKAGYVTAVRAAGVRGAGGESLLHDTFYYTLNQIPR